MEILLPKADSWFIRYDVVTGSDFLGPFHDSGDAFERIRIPKETISDFAQGGKLFGESSVAHQKLEGEISLFPLDNFEFTGDHTSNWVMDHNYPIYRIRDRHGYWWRTITDHLVSGALGYDAKRNSGYWMFMRWQRTSPNSWTRYQVSRYYPGDWYNPTPYYVSASITTFVVESKDGGAFVTQCWETLPLEEVPKDKSNDWNYYRSKADSLMGRMAPEIDDPPNHSVYKGYFSKMDFTLKYSASVSRIKDAVSFLLRPLSIESAPVSVDSYENLTYQAAKNMDANSVNMIAFIRDLKDVKSLIPKLKELSKLKTHADNYLSMNYGVLPTIDDLKSIWDAFQKTQFYDQNGFKRFSAYDKSVDTFSVADFQAPLNVVRRVHVAVNPVQEGLVGLAEGMRNIGIFPSLKNIWDLIPYSFVIDWFIDVGSVLDRIDVATRLLTLDIPYTLLSEKRECKIYGASPTDSSVGFHVALSRYVRTASSFVPQPKIFGNVNKPPEVLDHWIEGSALIIQRKKS